MVEKNRKITTAAITILAAALFIPLFITKGIGYFDFWWWMSVNIAILIGVITLVDPEYWPEVRKDLNETLLKKLLLALASAIFLYGLFYAGNIVSRWLFSFAGSGIEGVYDFRGGASALRIGLLMVIVIGPGEELLWRGFVQRRLQGHLGHWPGYVAASLIYGLVHLGSGNIMLVMAALVCGLFWGFLYLRYRSMALNVVSHVLWDIAVFLIFPFS